MSTSSTPSMRAARQWCRSTARCAPDRDDHYWSSSRAGVSRAPAETFASRAEQQSGMGVTVVTLVAQRGQRGA